MKADLNINQNRPVLTLWPESEDDKKKIAEFEKLVRLTHHVQSRGLGYMEPTASFYFWRGTDER